MSLNWWVVVGFVGQLLFFFRSALQWVVPELRGESVIPVGFWHLSLTGSFLLLASPSTGRTRSSSWGRARGPWSTSAT